MQRFNHDSYNTRRHIRKGREVYATIDQSSTLYGRLYNGSLEFTKSQSQPIEIGGFSPYGTRRERIGLGYTGENYDLVCEGIHLGQGERVYKPNLMRFTIPDVLSPFGAGGIHPYAYCHGDPINQVDPSGRISSQAIAGITLGVASLLLTLMTFGGSTPFTALSFASLSAMFVSDVASIAAAVYEGSVPEVSEALGWIALATGVVSFGFALGNVLRPLRFPFSRLSTIEPSANVASQEMRFSTLLKRSNSFEFDPRTGTWVKGSARSLEKSSTASSESFYTARQSMAYSSGEAFNTEIESGGFASSSETIVPARSQSYNPLSGASHRERYSSSSSLEELHDSGPLTRAKYSNKRVQVHRAQVHQIDSAPPERRVSAPTPSCPYSFCRHKFLPS